MQVRTKQLDSLNVVAAVELLVDGVRSIGRATHWQQKNILASCLLESKSDWNAAAFSGEIGLDFPHIFDSLGCCREVPVLGRCNPPLAGVLEEAVHCILRVELLENLVDVCKDELVNLRRLHIWDGSDAELASNLGWNDSLRTWLRESTLNTVE